MPRSLLSVTDLDPEDLHKVFRRSEEAAGDPLEVRRALAGRQIAGLFWQPAPRLEATLRASCTRMGAGYVAGHDLLPGFPDVDLLQAAEAAGAYADVLVIRHPLEGSARAAAAVAGVPVLNAGDGTREDPVRAVLVLRAMLARTAGPAPRAAALAGDLRRNRLGLSLAAGLSGLGTTVLLVPAQGGEMPEPRLAGMGEQLGHQPVRCAARSLRSVWDMVDTVVLEPDVPYQPALFEGLPDAGEDETRRARTAAAELDALFICAPRGPDGERLDDVADPEAHPWLEPDGRLAFPPFGRAPGAMPPAAGRLRDEALRDIPVMAELLSWAIGAAPAAASQGATGAREGIRCGNRRCVARRDPRVEPEYLVARRDPLVLRCRFCGTTVRPRFAGSRVERRYHPVGAGDVRKVLPRNMVYFAGWQDAEEAGFAPARTAGAADGGAADNAGGPATDRPPDATGDPA